MPTEAAYLTEGTSQVENRRLAGGHDQERQPGEMHVLPERIREGKRRAVGEQEPGPEKVPALVRRPGAADGRSPMAGHDAG